MECGRSATEEFELLARIPHLISFGDGLWDQRTERLTHHLRSGGLFSLPKKFPHGERVDWEAMVVDATEVAIERPPKTALLLQR